MTVATDTATVGYTGNGSQTVFAVPFYFAANTDLEVYDNGTLRTLNTHYTVTGAGTGSGNVTFTTAPTNTAPVRIRRWLPFTQTADYIAGGVFPAETHEAALDRLALQIQQVLGDLARRPSFDFSVKTGFYNANLPRPLANGLIGFDSTATGLQTFSSDVTAVAQAYLDDYSATVAQMQSAVDPGETGAESLATDVYGEIQRLRHRIAEIGGVTTWNQTATGIRAQSIAGASLPAASTAGRIAYRNNLARGLVVDTGAQFAHAYGNQCDVRMFGAVGDGVTNDTAAIQAAFDAAVVRGDTVHFPAGTYVCSSDLSTTAADGAHVRLHGPGAVLSMVAQGSVGGTSLVIQGSVGSSAALGANATEGDLTITCGLSVSAGDVIRLLSTTSFSPASVAFVKGELVEVTSAVAGTITLKTHLRDSYLAATTTVYKMNMPRVFVDGLTILRNDNSGRGLRVSYARDVVIHNVRVSGARDTGILIEQLFGASVSNCHVTDAHAGGGTDYSFALSSCQNVSVTGNQFLSGRHGVANGGTFPFRSITYTGNIVDNTHGITNYAFDAHANGQDLVVVGNVIQNAVDIECLDFILADNTIFSDDYTYGILINQYSNSRSVRYAQIRNNSVINLASGGNGIVFTTTNATAITFGSLSISGNIVESDGIALRITTGAANVTFDQVSIQGNIFRNATLFSVHIVTGGAGTLTATKMNVGGNICHAARGVLITCAGNLNFHGNDVFGTTAGLFLFETTAQTSVIVTGNTFNGDSDSAGVKFNTGNIIVFNSNLIINVNSSPLVTAAGLARLLESNNIYSNTSGTVTIDAATEYQQLILRDGTVAPNSRTGDVSIYIDTADGDAKLKFGDGFVRNFGADS